MTIEVGRNPYVPHCAYGDDSIFEDTLVYAYVFFHRKNVEKAIKKISVIKKQFRIPEDLALHCRILFSGHQRKKAGLSHLKPIQVKRLIAMLVGRMNKIDCLLRYTYCHIPESGILFADSDNGEFTVKNEYKGALGILSQGCFAPYGNLPLADQCEIFASADKTKINFFGKRKRRADAFCSAFSSVASTQGTVKVMPHIMDTDHPLQQLADIYAYICSHALSEKCRDPFFSEQLRRVKSFTRGVFEVDLQPIISPENV